jgi:hypothetical protein
MMSRFIFERRTFLAITTAMALLGGSLAYVPQDAHAASEWSEILKPLVKDVLIPGAKLGVKKFSERHTKHKDEQGQVIEVNEVEIPQPSSDWQQAPPPPEWNASTPEGWSEADVAAPTPDGPVFSQAEEPMTQANDFYGGAEPPPPPPPPFE